MRGGGSARSTEGEESRMRGALSASESVRRAVLQREVFAALSKGPQEERILAGKGRGSCRIKTGGKDEASKRVRDRV